MTVARRAAFLDRDGTLIEDASYLADPAAMRLVSGVDAALRKLAEEDVLVVVVTNQSGIALGLLSEEQYEATRRRLDELLAQTGAVIDATYHCPHHPDVDGPCECRKPGTKLYRSAAADLGVDLARSFFAGDRYRDIAPGIALGGFVRLVPSPSSLPDEVARAEKEGNTSPTLMQAVEDYLARSSGV
jgi:D-glycero-D-manno-heptose 1,7-bisphosphate phosphatase